MGAMNTFHCTDHWGGREPAIDVNGDVLDPVPEFVYTVVYILFLYLPKCPKRW